MHPKLTSAEAAGTSVMLRWSDGATDAVTALWLRHACHCPDCRTGAGGQQRVDIAAVAPDQRLDHVALAHEGGGGGGADHGAGEDDGADGVVVGFGDGHGGFVPTWVLADRRPGPEPRRWGVEHGAVLRLAGADDDLDRVARAVTAEGIALLRAPTVEGEVVRVAEQLGHVRATNYGRSFDVVVEPDPANLAYSATALPLHTDNPYREPVPTVQLLHWLAAGNGGVSRFADGFAAAERLAADDPAAFELLTATPVAFHYADAGVDLRAERPLIDVDGRGAIRAVHLNSRSMQAPTLATDRIDDFYRAHRAFVAEIDRPDAVVELELGPGDLVVFDNRRVLHGRTAFAVEVRRHLQGCYIDIDAVRSRARMLELEEQELHRVH